MADALCRSADREVLYLPEDMTSICDRIWGSSMGSRDEKERATRGRMKSDPRRPGRDLSLLK